MDNSPKGGPAGALSTSERRRLGFPPSTTELIPREFDPDTISELKRRINDMIWTYGPESITLAHADHIACKILDSIINGKFDA